MQIRPILTALRHHRVATLLIALEIALACAVLCNACFLIMGRMDAINITTGIDEKSLAFLSLNGYDPDHVVDLNARVVAGLSAIPGVEGVGVINDLPFTQSAGMVGVTADPAKQHYHTVDMRMGDAASLRLMGLNLVSGRMPGPGDYQPIHNFIPDNASVLVTRALAAKLWPGVDPLGKELWCADSHLRVTGVVDHLALADPDGMGASRRDYSIFMPALPGKQLSGNYVLRANPRELPEVYRKASLAVTKIAPDAVFDHESSGMISDLRETYFRSDRILIGMLAGVILALMLVTALGIVGLASFWVQQRRRQIGIRRAIGATRSDILHYFQLENFLIVTMGIVIGIVLAYGMNLMLMKAYEVSRLPVAYLLVSALVLWLLGQLAVLGPALRAAAVPPVVATRTV